MEINLNKATASMAEKYFKLGSIYYNEADFDLAEKAFLAAIAANPHYEEAHNYLTCVYITQGLLIASSLIMAYNLRTAPLWFKLGMTCINVIIHKIRYSDIWGADSKLADAIADIEMATGNDKQINTMQLAIHEALVGVINDSYQEL